MFQYIKTDEQNINDSIMNNERIITVTYLLSNLYIEMVK
jgi:hypothetical protein